MIRLIAIAGLAATLLAAQESAPKIQFEVASVKLDPSCAQNRGGGDMPRAGRLTQRCTTVENLIQIAYVILANGATPNMKNVEITGAPAWARSDLYSINAKAEGAALVSDMYGPMLRQLLEERFQLKIHKETKEASVYNLTLAKGGAKFKPTPEGSCTPIDINNLPAEPKPGEKPPAICPNMRTSGNGKSMKMSALGVTMGELSGMMLSRFLDRPVIDHTGLSGRFDIDLEFAPEGMPMFGGGGRGVAGPGDGSNMPLSSDPTGPTIYTALEKAGLKLEPAKGPKEVLVVDHVERPTEN